MKSMKTHERAKCAITEESFYGTSTLGERGQIVIPAEARAAMGFHAGDKLLIMRHPVHPGVVVFKLEDVREFLDEFNSMFRRAEAAALADDTGEEA